MTCLHECMTRKVLAIAGSAVFLVVAPGFVAGWVSWWLSRWRLEAPFFGMRLFRFAGGMLLTLGVIGLLARIIHERSFEGESFADPAFKSDHGRKLSSASTDSGEVSDVRGWIPALRETSGQAG